MDAGGSEKTGREIAESVVMLLNMEIAFNSRQRKGLDGALEELELMGFATGSRLVTKLTEGRCPIPAEKEAVRFICKEVWQAMFRKQATRLQTDRRGSYIIQDSAFRWLEQLAPPPSGGHDTELHETALLSLAYPCGLIRGALLGVGVECTVAPEVSVSSLPACSFTVSLRESRSRSI
mmetsp:Transcript_38820/g.91301  ORF Transcript_38820/g.91301 Transcript_38820/m.91301 type:complete len:178 (-) Transcript_38820:23-556(-)